MKKLFSVLFCLTILFSLSFSAFGDTASTTSNLVNQATVLVNKVTDMTDKVPGAVSNATQFVKEQTTAAVHSQTATNLNQLMLEVLSGARDVGKEMYGASKSAISSSISFVQEQAPLVVKQFLYWRFCESLLWVLIGGGIGGFVYYLGRKLHKAVPTFKYESDKKCGLGFGWFAKISAVAIIIIFVGFNSFTMVKIAVAPKVYILEYVVDLAKDATSDAPRGQRR